MASEGSLNSEDSMHCAKDSWEDFCYRYIDLSWFDGDRCKTLAAMKKLWERVPQDDLDKLPGFLIVFAPAISNLGEAFPLSLFGPEEAPRGALIYLSPLLEEMSQEEVDSTVAHEFAHLVLGCYRPDYTRNIRPVGAELKTPGDLPSERDADALISSWGFKAAHKSNQN